MGFGAGARRVRHAPGVRGDADGGAPRAADKPRSEGADKPKEKAPDKKDVVKDIQGRWDHGKTEAVYLRFNRDGTFRWVTLKGTIVGNWRVLEGGAIEFITLTPQRTLQATELKFRLKDDVLELKIGEEWHMYSKTK